MALIVEDGSIVADANSYQSAADLTTYAAARGVTLDPALVDIYAIKAMDYIERFAEQFKGELVEPGVQPLSWPRKCVHFGDWSTLFPDNAIPKQLKQAQGQLAIELKNGINLMPVSGSDAFITREKVDVIETEYSEAMALKMYGTIPVIPYVDDLLFPLLNNGGFTLRTERI